jgi:hypothetical protein
MLMAKIYSVTIVATIKFFLFVYYVELIGTKLWMVEEGAALNGGLEI